MKAEREKVASMKNAGDSDAVVIKNLFKVHVMTVFVEGVSAGKMMLP